MLYRVANSNSCRPANLADSSGSNSSRLISSSPRLLPGKTGKAGKKGQLDVLAFTGKEKSAVIERLRKAGEQTVEIESGGNSTRTVDGAIFTSDYHPGLTSFLYSAKMPILVKVSMPFLKNFSMLSR